MTVKNNKLAKMLVLAFIFVFTIGFTPASWYGMINTPSTDGDVTTETETMGNGDFGSSDVIDGNDIQAKNAVWTVDTAYVNDMLDEHVFTREWVDIKSDTYKTSSDASKAAYLGAIAEESDGNVSLNPLLLYASAQKWTPQLLKDNDVKSYKDFYKTKSGKVTEKGKAVYTAFKEALLSPDVYVTTGTVKATATNTGSSSDASVVANANGGITGDRSGWAIQTKSAKTASVSNPLVLEAYAAESSDSGSWVNEDWSEDSSAEQMTRCGNAVYDKVSPKAPKGPTDDPKKPPKKKKKDPPKPDKPKPKPKDPNENITKKPGAEDLAGDGENHNDQGEGTDEKPDMSDNDAPIIEDNDGGNDKNPTKDEVDNGGNTDNDQGSGSDEKPTVDSSSDGSSDSGSSSSGSDSNSGGSSDSGSSSSSGSDSSSGSSSSGSSDSGSSSSGGSSDSGSSSSSGGSSDSGSSSSGNDSSSGESDSDSSGEGDTSSVTQTSVLAAYLPNTVFGQAFNKLTGGSNDGADLVNTNVTFTGSI